MQTCVIQSSRFRDPRALPQGSAGFTLLEILIVLFIVAIMSGVVVANLPSFAQTDDFDTETRRLKTLLDLARLEAQVQTSEFGFKPGQRGYEFRLYDESQDKWLPVQARPFSPRELGAEITLSVKIEDNSMKLGGETSTGGAPPILILSSGEITPFELTLTTVGAVSRTLLADGYSELRWQDEAPDGQ